MTNDALPDSVQHDGMAALVNAGRRGMPTAVPGVATAARALASDNGPDQTGNEILLSRILWDVSNYAITICTVHSSGRGCSSSWLVRAASSSAFRRLI